MNPDPFTLRELVKMAEGRGKMEWGRTSCLMALVANILRDPKKSKPVKPADFNPYLQKAKPVQRVNIAQLKTMLGGNAHQIVPGERICPLSGRQ
ncbi:MAG: hypothetical protein AB7F40_02175 [Victivallaceae bacterium]